jgi:hypothetical protein
MIDSPDVMSVCRVGLIVLRRELLAWRRLLNAEVLERLRVWRLRILVMLIERLAERRERTIERLAKREWMPIERHARMHVWSVKR